MQYVKAVNIMDLPPVFMDFGFGDVVESIDCLHDRIYTLLHLPYPLHPSTSCSKGITLKLMEMEAGFILLGISLSDLKVKLQLSSPHCL